MERKKVKGQMSLKETEKLALRRFCQEISYRPRFAESQPHERANGCFWCQDWEIIEVLKFFFLGEEIYFVEAPPRRLRNNPLWSKEKVKTRALELYETFGGNIEAMIENLRSLRNGTASRIC